MGTNQTIRPSKSEKSSSIIQEQPSIHPFPDWASMQAYYGPGVSIQAPYFSAAVPPCHTPHPYMWSPQPILTPFGGPYTAIYPHGVYSHPPSSHIASPVNAELPAIHSTSKDRGFEKKIKGHDKLATSIADCNVKGAACKENRSSESGDNEAEYSSYGSDVNNESAGSERKRNRSFEAIPNAASDAPPTITLAINTASSTITGKSLCSAPSTNLTPGMDLRSSYISKLKTEGENFLSTTTTMDERELKQEKRKQSNRESARRSRLRKQAETEELAIKVGTMTAENTNLRAEITQLTESSDKLRLENSVLMEKLRMVEQTQEEDMMSDRIDDEEAPSIVIKNLLSSIGNSSPICCTNQMEDESFENSSGKLHQLLDPNPKSDSLTAS